MNDAETAPTTAQTLRSTIAPFVEAAAQFSGTFYDNLNSSRGVDSTLLAYENLTNNFNSTSGADSNLLANFSSNFNGSGVQSTLLTSTDSLSQAVIRLMSRAGEKRAETSGSEEASKRRKIRRTQSHLMHDGLGERRPRSVIIGPGRTAQPSEGRLFLGSSSPMSECNKNFVFNEEVKPTNENDSSEGPKSHQLNGGAWQVGPSTSTHLSQSFSPISHNVVGLLHQNQHGFQTSKVPQNSTTLTLPDSIIQLSSSLAANQDSFGSLDRQQSQTTNSQNPQQEQNLRFTQSTQNSTGQFAAFQSLFNGPNHEVDSKTLRQNGHILHQQGEQENFSQRDFQARLNQTSNGYQPLINSASSTPSRRARRFSHQGSNNEGGDTGLLLHQHRHKHLPRGTPTLQQIGRNLIEFARSSTPRIQRRIQSAKSHLQQNDNTQPHQPLTNPQRLTISANNSPVHHLHYPSANSRRQTHNHHRQSATHNGSSNHTHQQNTNCDQQISCAHPDYHIEAFLDEGMRPTKLDALLDLPEPSQKQMEEHSWNPEDRSLNIYVKEEDRLTLHRHPVAQSTDCIRGRVGFSKGFHVWQLVWPLRQRGTHAVIGVATKDAPLHSPGYSSLVGSTEDSYGWDLIRNVCLHDSKNTKSWTYPNPELVGERFNIPEKLYCILDMEEGTLAFSTEHTYLGVAFRNLRGQTLYPVVCAVWGHCEITMKYMGNLEPEPRGLMDICRRTIRMQLGPQRIQRVNELPLPEPLKNYIQYRPRYES